MYNFDYLKINIFKFERLYDRDTSKDFNYI